MPSYRPPRQDAERLRLERERVAAERGRAAERKMREQRPRVRRGERPPWQDDLGSDALESDAKFSDAVRSDAADGDRSRWTVDVHSHVYLPRYIQMLRDRGSVPRIQTIDGQDRLLILPDEDKGTSTGARARAMPLSHLASSILPSSYPAPDALRSQGPADWRRVLEPRPEARVHGHPPHRRVGALDGKPVARLCRRPARGG
jgi:hypothetical protein